MKSSCASRCWKCDLLELVGCSSQEFIDKYIDSRNKLLERKEEVMREVVDHARQQDEV